MAAELPPVWVKTYQARTMPEATALLQGDATAAWADGYSIGSQVWADGGRTSAAAACLFLGVTVLAAGVLLWLPLCLAGLFLLVAGALSGKGPGTLSVTFARR